MSSGSNGLHGGAISQQTGRVFLTGRFQAPRQLSFTFYRSSYKLTILWHAPHSSRIHLSASAALTSVDGTEEKRIRAPTSSEYVCGRPSLPAHSYLMEGEGEPYIQAVQSHICTRWMRPTRLGKRLQRCPLWLCSRSSRPRCSPERKSVWMQLYSG